MKKHVALASLTMTCLVVASLHIDWVQHDNGHLLFIDSAPIDLFGEINEHWNQVTRQCDQVQRISPEEQLHAQALAVIMDYSPPQSRSAHLASLWSAGDWLLAEVEFEELLPAVVMIQKSSTQLSIIPHGVWSGITKPWKAAPHIRNYLIRQVTHAPVDLLRCFDPQSNAF